MSFRTAGWQRQLMWAGVVWLLACGQGMAQSQRLDAKDYPDDILSAPLAHAEVGPAFADVPVEWRDYWLKARAAEEIGDPLQRCLAYPDLPGNQWPQGHAAAHCRSHFSALRLKPSEVQGYLDRGDLTGLGARLDAMQAKHSAKGDAQGEDIHYFFDDLVANPATDALTARWLAQMPDDAYALLARATYLNEAAWDARGSQFAPKVGEEAWKKAHALAEQALPLYRRAAAQMPALMPAYSGAMNLAMMASDSDTQLWAMKQAEAVDPACMMMAKATLVAITPRWGGDYFMLAAYEVKLATYLPERPLLALYLSRSLTDRADMLLRDEAGHAEAVQLLAQAARNGSGEGEQRLASDALFANKGDIWLSRAYQLQADRFQPGSAATSQILGQFLLKSDPRWAAHILQRAVRVEPDNARSQALLGRALAASGDNEGAERAYLAVAKDPKRTVLALEQMASFWLYPEGADAQPNPQRAAPLLKRLLAADPHNGMGWLLQLDVLMRQRQSIPDATLQNALKYADRKDPWQADRARRWEQLIREAGNKR